VIRREFLERNTLLGAIAGVGARSFADGGNAARETSPLESATFVPEYFGRAEPGKEGQLLKAGFAERDITFPPMSRGSTTGARCEPRCLMMGRCG